MHFMQNTTHITVMQLRKEHNINTLSELQSSSKYSKINGKATFNGLAISDHTLRWFK
jgi:hypothetical protein